MNGSEFIHFPTDDGEKIVSRTSIALIEKVADCSRYKITLKERRKNGENISFFITASYGTLLNLFGGNI